MNALNLHNHPSVGSTVICTEAWRGKWTDPSSQGRSAAGRATASLRLGSLPGQRPGRGALCMAPVWMGGQLSRLCLGWGSPAGGGLSFPHNRAFRVLSPKACAFDVSSWVLSGVSTGHFLREGEGLPGAGTRLPVAQHTLRAQEEVHSRLRSQPRAGRSEREVGWPLGLTGSKQPRW